MVEHGERFTGRVEAYERFRQGYPEALLEVLRERCGLTSTYHVADIGAGTGMVADLLLKAGCRVTAVEPNAEMRAACVRLLGSSARLEVVDAAAEATGLAAGSVTMVTAGRAFHWFDRERALGEFARILQPGGWVVLLSNRRAEDGSEQARAYEAILREHGNDYEKLHGNKRNYDDLLPYGAEDRFSVALAGEQPLDLAAFLGQTQSLSVVPLADEPKYAAIQEALHEFFRRWSQDGILRVETRCDVTGWRTPRI